MQIAVEEVGRPARRLGHLAAVAWRAKHVAVLRHNAAAAVRIGERGSAVQIVLDATRTGSIYIIDNSEIAHRVVAALHEADR